MSFTKKKWIYLFLGLVLGITVMVIPAPAGLEPIAMKVIGILLCAILWWAGNVFPEVVTALLMSIAYIIIAKVPAATSFNAFSGTTYWLLVAAFALGAAIKACGLLERVSIMMLKIFPKSYRGQIFGLLAVSTVVSPFVPSKAAKCGVLSPLTRGISDAMGYRNESRQATGLFLAYYSAICLAPAMFTTASITTAALVGMLPEATQHEFTMVKWAICAAPFVLLCLVMHYFYLSKAYNTEGNKKFDLTYLDERLKEMGPWTKKEKTMGVIMVITVLCWVTKSIHGIPEYAVALVAACACVVFDILPVKSFRSNIAWESLIFIACSISIGNVLTHVGLTPWLAETIGPYTSGFFGNPFLLIIGLAAVTLVVRFLILSEIGFLTVFTALCIPLGTAAGVNPWVIGFVLNAFVIGWFLPYQSSVYLTALYGAGEGWITVKDTTRYCFVYCIIALIAMFITYFIWNVAGVWYV